MDKIFAAVLVFIIVAVIFLVVGIPSLILETYIMMDIYHLSVVPILHPDIIISFWQLALLLCFVRAVMIAVSSHHLKQKIPNAEDEPWYNPLINKFAGLLAIWLLAFIINRMML